MASIDSPLSSAELLVRQRHLPPADSHGSPERHYLLVSRIAVAGFGLLLAGIAVACAPVESLVDFAFQVFALPGGPMLGVFLLGLLTRRQANLTNIPAMLISTAVFAVLLRSSG